MMLWLRGLKKKYAIATIIACCVISLAVFIALKLRPVPFKISPRPTPSQIILDDSALARHGSLPDVNRDWQKDAMARHMPIRSLFSDDFSDLQFLKPLLKGKRLVMLGESGHGVAEYSWMKARLIRFLHQEMGFDVLAFEGSMTGAYYVDKGISEKSADDSLYNAVFGTWHTEEVKQVFSYLKASRKQSRPLAFAGFDIQNSSAHARTSAASLFKQMLGAIKSPLAARVDEIEKTLSQVKYASPSLEAVAEVSSFYREVLGALTMHHAKLEKAFAREPAIAKLVVQEVQSRIKLVEFLRLSASDPKSSSDVRDAMMAENLNFLLDKIYPDRKVIVWAHNAHIGTGYPWNGVNKNMGAWIAETRKPETYSIGFFMGRGGHVST